MSSINIQTPLITLPKLYENSSMNSPRESNSLFLLWKIVNSCAMTINKLINNTNQLAKEVNGLSQKNNMDMNMFPFKIYSLPDVFYPPGIPTNFDTNWRTVRIRGGYVLNSVVSTGSLVTGTDLWQQLPYQNVLPLYSGSIDITIPNNTPQYWFWISNNSGNYSLSYGANPTSPDSGSVWSNFPNASNTSIPIGYVDTNSSSSIHLAFVRQFLNADVVVQGASGGLNYRGTYNPVLTYNNNDIVTIGSGVTAGGYICTINGNTNAPDSGIGWAQWPQSGLYL